jgi:phosphonate transport system substrate-binding protein
MRKFAALALVVPAVALAQDKKEDKAPITIGITKPIGAKAAVDSGKTIATALSAALGRTVKHKLFTDAQALADALAEGKVELAWITPVAYVQAATKQKDLVPIRKCVRHGQGYYLAAFFAKEEKGYRSLDDIKGKKVAWLPETSAAGHVFARSILIKAGHDPEQYFGEALTLQDHKAVCEAVKSGQADVGATFADPKPDKAPVDPDGCKEALGDTKGLMVVATSNKIPNDVVAAKAGLDAALVEAVGKALDGMGKSMDGKAALTDGFKAEGFAPVEDGDMDPVRTAVLAVTK